MILGYLLRAPDNDSYMLQGPTPYPTCRTCGFATYRDWIDPQFALSRRDYDASYAYDGYFIVSERFCNLVLSRGGRCIALPSVPGFYALRADETVRFDAVRRKVRFSDLCPECGQSRSVIGGPPVFLVDPQPLPDRLVRSDIEFGSGDEKHPLLMTGSNLATELANAGLTVSMLSQSIAD